MTDEQLLWNALVVIYGWQFHPRNPADNRMSVQECGDQAVRLVRLYRSLTKDEKWRLRTS